MAFTVGTGTFTNGSATVTNVSLSSGTLAYFASGTRMVVGVNPVVREIEAIAAPTVTTITLRSPWQGTGGTYDFLANQTSEGLRDAVQSIRSSNATIQSFIDSIDVQNTADSVVQRTANGRVKTSNATESNDAVALGQINSVAVGLTGNQTIAGVKTFSSDTVVNSLTVGRGAGNDDSNTAIGLDALSNNTTGISNTATGSGALRDNTTGINNTVIGRSALLFNTTGENNTVIGRSALVSNATGNANTAIGLDALRDNTTGSNNIGIGFNSGRAASPFLVITQSNRIVMGNNNHTDAYIRIAWTVTSDARDKTNFEPVPHGLDFVNQLEPVAYQFRVDRESDETTGKVRYGFKAQDILALEGDNPVVIDDEDPEHLKYKGEALVPILVNAIKELTARVEALEGKK